MTLPWIIYFNPRAPCGARRTVRSPVIGANAFQSTRPMRGATNDWGTGSFDWEISIHAPHAGRDGSDTEAPASLFRFQSTRPMRGATGLFILIWASVIFQSTRPMRGATLRLRQHGGKPIFQSTRPMRGATAMRTHGMTCGANFNPRAPCGARPRLSAAFIRHSKFQSTRPMRGATR